MPDKFIQIATGEYTYNSNYGDKNRGHCVYALDQSGQIWKWIPGHAKWLKLEEALPPNLSFKTNNNQNEKRDSKT